MTASQTFDTLPTLAAGRWQTDHHHSAITFAIRHFGLSKVRGRFETFDVTLDVGPSPTDLAVTATIDLASINTNNTDRDTHLRSTDFFKVDEHPTISFHSASIDPSADGYTMSGDLTLNGITRVVTLNVESNGLAVFPGDGKTHAGLSATGELRRSEFGIEFGMMPLGVDRLALADVVSFELEMQLVEP
ncbi:MAG TPA: YceI family protein [Chloroflexota bacterium]|jgi:polyisoprenoid-binding protein YceI|nr:YceI family protein [Chloroflexota bacterium]